MRQIRSDKGCDCDREGPSQAGSSATAVKTPPARQAAPKPAAAAKAISRPIIPEKAVAKVDGERQKALNSHKRAGTNRPAKKSAPAVTSDVLEVPVRGRGRPPGSKKQGAAGSQTDTEAGEMVVIGADSEAKIHECHVGSS